MTHSLLWKHNNITLSRAVVNNDNILVALDGVMQYPSDNSTTRAYNVTGTGSNSLHLRLHLQMEHNSCKTYWFCGASTSGVSGFLGRQGNVQIIDSDPIVGIQSGGLGIGTVRTLNFIGGNTVQVRGNVIDISIGLVEVQVRLPHQSQVYKLQLNRRYWNYNNWWCWPTGYW